jgi:DNA-binding transcriptional LysR family regulator
MRVSLHQLRLFRAVAESGSLARAASKVHITQAALSLQLKDLAETLGTTLITRQGRQQQLTPAGELTLRAARRIQETLEQLESELASLKGLQTGHLRIAAATTAEYFVPALLGSFHERFPGIDIELIVANRAEIVARLREQRDDLTVMARPPADLVLVDVPLLENPLVLIASRDHALARCDRLSLADLADEPFVLREAGSGTRLIADAWLKATGFTPKASLALGSNEAIKQAVAAGLGLSIISQLTLKAGELDTLAILPVEGFPIPSHWHLVHPENRALSPPAREFMRHAVEAACGLRPPAGVSQ